MKKTLTAFSLLAFLLLAQVSVTFAQEDSCPLPSKPQRTPPAVIVAPFLTLPFDKSRKMPIVISEADFYSPEEKAIHGHEIHYGIDFDAPQGEPLYAPCSGWAVQGFHTAKALDAKGSPIFLKEKYVGFGLGHFVQIFCDNAELNVTLAHMQEVANYIPSVEQNKDKEKFNRTLEWSPDGIYTQFPDKTTWKHIKRGRYIGRVGHSGLGLGIYEDPWHITETSWDSYHVHMEVYRRKPDGYKDANFRYDPFGWYTQVSKAPYNDLRQSPSGLWLTDKKKRIRYALKD